MFQFACKQFDHDTHTHARLTSLMTASACCPNVKSCNQPPFSSELKLATLPVTAEASSRRRRPDDEGWCESRWIWDTRISHKRVYNDSTFENLIDNATRVVSKYYCTPAALEVQHHQRSSKESEGRSERSSESSASRRRQQTTRKTRSKSSSARVVTSSSAKFVQLAVTSEYEGNV